MRILCIFILKLIATIFAGIILWCHFVIALILWDDEFLKMEDGIKKIWRKKP